MYLPGDTVLITDIGVVGVEVTRHYRADPGRSLVCETRNINTQCCREKRDYPYRRVGEWYFPHGSAVFPFPFPYGFPPGYDFVRRAFTQEVRLERRNNAISPTGKYECRVPDEVTGELVNASITLTTG